MIEDGQLIVGFTGTRKGMNELQSNDVYDYLRELNIGEAHHGDCVGADADFHDICLDLKIPVVLHPPENPRLRAYCQGATFIERPKPYLVRNEAIVDRCDLLIAAPKEHTEPAPGRGQGTWATVRYARRFSDDVLVLIVWPV